MSNMGETLIKFEAMLVGILIIFVYVFIAPFVFFWLAYISGWIVSLVIGKPLVAGLGLLGIKITTHDIPLIAATLGWVGGYFKSGISQIQQANNKN